MVLQKQKSQYDYCVECPYFKRGFTHAFLKGWSNRCTNNEFFEMYSDDLAVRIPFCEGFDPAYPECHECSNFKYYGDSTCRACMELEAKTCLLCPNLLNQKNGLCTIHGKTSKELNCYGYRKRANECKDFGKKKEIPKDCKHCKILKEENDCPFNFDVKKCLESI